MQRLIPVVFLGLLAAGCATTKAAAPVERPTLEVPPVPPRVVEPAPMPESHPIEPVAELPPASAPAPTKPRPSSSKESREGLKPEPKPETPPPPDPAASAPIQNAAPPTLRTPATADATAVERQIRDTLGRARAGFKSIDYQRLTPERKKRYDEGTDFIAGAEAAIKTGNFELAKDLAVKAETYAKELQTR